LLLDFCIKQRTDKLVAHTTHHCDLDQLSLVIQSQTLEY
jgi:hypothetical protein